jgi:hypothetical protein
MYSGVGCIGLDCLDIVLGYYNPLHSGRKNGVSERDFHPIIFHFSDFSFEDYRSYHKKILNIIKKLDKKSTNNAVKYIMNISEIKALKMPYIDIINMSSIKFALKLMYLYDHFYPSDVGIFKYEYYVGSKINNMCSDILKDAISDFPFGAFGNSCWCRSFYDEYDEDMLGEFSLNNMRIKAYICSSLNHKIIDLYNKSKHLMVFKSPKDFVIYQIGIDSDKELSDVSQLDINKCHDYLLKVKKMHRIGNVYFKISKKYYENEFRLAYGRKCFNGDSTWTSEFPKIGLINID